MNISPMFFVGIAVLILFGIKALIVFVIGYFIYTEFFEGEISKKNSKKLTKSIEKMIAELFEEKSSAKRAEDAKIVNKKIQAFNIFNMNNFSFKGMFGIIALIISILLFLDGFVNVPAGHVAVIIDKGRGVLSKSLPTGLHLKIPFWQTVTIMDVRLQAYTMSIASGEGELYGNDAIDALTKDGQQIKIDVTVQYLLPQNNAAAIYSEVGPNYIEKIVRPPVRSVIRSVVTGFNSKELFQIETRKEAEKLMVDRLREKFEGKKIVLDDVLLRNIQFSDVYLSAIEEKQIAEQQIQKAEFEKKTASIIKDKKIIEAEAEAEAIKLKGESLNKNPSVIQFEMVQKLSPNVKWGVLPDGVLPMLNLKDMQN